MQFLKLLKNSFLSLLFFSILLGIIYPFFVYLIGAGFFHHKARGSLLYEKNVIIGSKLIGQQFLSEKYFHSRPARSTDPYNPLELSSPNYGPTSLELKKLIEKDIESYKTENLIDGKIPIDAITASCSGLDPDISLENALIQAPRVAKARSMSVDDVVKAIKKNKEKRFLKIMGNERVNVLKLNLYLDNYKKN